MAQLITVGRAAKLLGKSDTYVRTLIEREKLPVHDRVLDASQHLIVILNEEHVLRLKKQLAECEAA